MKRIEGDGWRCIVAFALLTSGASAIACEDMVSPALWYLINQAREPVPISVFETAGHANADLTFQYRNDQVSFSFPRAKKGYRWAYGSCAPNKKMDPSVFALVKESDLPGWKTDIKMAYRINVDSGKVSPEPISNMYCF